MVVVIHLTLSGEHMMQYVDNILESCILETSMVSLTSVTPNKFNNIFKSAFKWIHEVHTSIVEYSTEFSQVLNPTKSKNSILHIVNLKSF